MQLKRFVVGTLSTNCYVISKGTNCILVDPGGDAALIKKHILKKGFFLDFIIYTHGHADHLRGGLDFNCPMYIHKDDTNCLFDASLNLSAMVGMPFTFSENCEVNDLSDGDLIDFEGQKIQVIHTPGHTIGGISLYFDDVLISGDTLFHRSIGRADLPGGDFDILMSSVAEKLFILPESTKVYPGHGDFTSIGAEKKKNPFFS